MKSHRKKYLIKKDRLQELLVSLVGEYSLPAVRSSLGMYTEHQEKILEVTFADSSCYMQRHDADSELNKKFIEVFSSTPPIGIQNKNIKYFLRVINDLGFSDAYISDTVVQMEFCKIDAADHHIKVDLGTPIGDLMTVDEGLTGNRAAEYQEFIDRELTSSDIGKRFEGVGKEALFDESSILNHKVTRYGNEFGIDLMSSGSASIKSSLSNKSNDYSVFSNHYNRLVKVGAKSMRPISIIVPAYNSEDTILQVLLAIEGQDLSLDEKRMIEVVVVDDGSNVLVSDMLKDRINSFSFKLKIVRLETRSGLSAARNIGVAATSNEHLLFIDSDILLSKNYLAEHSNRLRFYPEAVFVSMKKNIERDSDINNPDRIMEGLEIPSKYDDKRMARISAKGQNWINKIDLDGVYEILSDTNAFKDFGYGRMINGYDLPSMVVGHNMSLKKSLFIKSGGFSDKFIGWGLEDTYFGARLIANGCFVIPILECGVYHLNHPPRSGSVELQEKEYVQNLKTYEELINKNHE